MQQNVANTPENLIYYYHPDHLGSSSFISDASGLASQHLEYFPFGETFVEENVGSFFTRYKFNAKEQDEESALYYYGARYYDPKTSVWLGVDPMADKYPGLSPFVYCQNNPTMLIDPDGMDSFEIDEENGKVSKVDKTQYFREKDNSITTVKDGEKYNGNGKAVDKITNSSGESQYYTAGRLGNGVTTDAYQFFTFNDPDEAAEFYYFAAGSTKAEYAFAKFGAKGGVVGTDFNHENTTMPARFESYYGPMITYSGHSHPTSGGPPLSPVYVEGKWQSGALLNAQNSKYPDIPREVYDVPGRKLYFYDGSTNQKRKSGGAWDSKPFNQRKR